MLGKHLRTSHDTTIEAYQQEFPDAEVTSQETRERMRNSNVLTGKTVGSLEDRFGDERAKEIKRKIGKNSGDARVGKPRPNQAITLKQTWSNKKEIWSEGIRRGYTGERKQKLSDTMRQVVSSNNRNTFKSSAFEVAVSQWLKLNNFHFISQYRISDNTLGTAFFDFFIPELNLVIECDGEYWHKAEKRIKNDLRKNQILNSAQIKILRLSDLEFTRTFSNIELIANLLTLTDEELAERNQQLINNRLLKLRQ